MEKRGLSNVVAIVLIILLILAAILIIWIFAQGFVIKQGEISEAQTTLLTGEIEITNYNNGNLTLEKKSGAYRASKNITEILPPEVDLISIIDLSGSMLSGTPPLIDEAKQANIELINSLLEVNPDNRIGVVGFANIIYTNSFFHQLARDNNSLINAINGFQINVNTHTTCICCGINRSVQEFQNSPKEKLKLMIIMTDGLPSGVNSGSVQDDICFIYVSDSDPTRGINQTLEAARFAKNNLENLIIYTVGFETQNNNIATDTLIEVAEIGGGRYFHADTGDLLEVYTSIIEEVKTTYSSVKSYDNVIIAFYDDKGNVLTKQIPFGNLPLEVFQTKDYDFSEIYSELPGNLIKIEIYATVTTSSGYKVQGQVMDVWEINP